MNLPIIKPLIEEQEQVASLVENIISNKQKSLDYQLLLDNAKKSNSFEREIQITKELEVISEELERDEIAINTIIYELYEVEPSEIATIEKSIN